MIKNKNSLTVIQINDSHAYFDLHQEMFWQAGQAVYRRAGGYARIAALVKQTQPAARRTSGYVCRGIGYLRDSGVLPGTRSGWGMRLNA